MSAFFSAVACSYAATPGTSTYAESDDDPVIVLQEDDETTATDSALVSSNSSEADSYANKEITPDEAYRVLVSGNARHIGDGSDAADEKPRLAADGNQYPIATIIYSSDMPEDPTTLTETTEHNVYLTTAKGGAVSTDDLASIEYGILNLQTPLLVVLGHYPSAEVASMIEKYDELKSRAQTEVKKALKTKDQDSSIKTSDEMKLYNLVGPAVARAKEAYPDIEGQDLANVVSEALVWQSLETILMKSTVAQDLVRTGRLLAIAAIVENETGKIYWLGEHPLQEEFVKEAPESVRKASKEETAESVVSESELPPALDEATVKADINNYQTNEYYKDVVNEYYVEPTYYVPSWRLFYPRVWVYRPWRGVCVRPFVPWPYWSPWGYPPGVGGLHLAFGVGRINLFIGYNCHWGAYTPWDPHFAPVRPWWGVDFFMHCDHFRHPEYGIIFGGFRADLIVVPHDRRPGWRPGDPFGPGGPGDPFRPGGPGDPFKPGGPLSPEGGFVGPGGIRPGYHPGDVRPGGAPGTPGGRPGVAPGTPGGRPGVAPGFPDRGMPAAPGTRLGSRPGTPGIRPGMNPRSMDTHREMEASRRAGGGIRGGGGLGGRGGGRPGMNDVSAVDSGISRSNASGVLSRNDRMGRGASGRSADVGSDSRVALSTIRGQANDSRSSRFNVGDMFRNKESGRSSISGLEGGKTRTFDSSVVARMANGAGASRSGRPGAGIGAGMGGRPGAGIGAAMGAGGGGRPGAGRP